jgi:hypothetical protein
MMMAEEPQVYRAPSRRLSLVGVTIALDRQLRAARWNK